MFQFHSGSIKRVLTCWKRSAPPTFQFHSGSIKSHIFDKLAEPLYVFQFHSGSIKRQARHILNGMRGRFNSTVVRLKA